MERNQCSRRLALVKPPRKERVKRCSCPAGHQLAVTELVIRRRADGAIVRRLRPAPGGFVEVP